MNGEAVEPRHLARDEDVAAVIQGVLARLWEEHGNGAPLPDVGYDENLFDVGLVDSFGMLEVVAEIESLTGEPIDFTVVDPETIFSMRGITEFIRQRRAKT